MEKVKPHIPRLPIAQFPDYRFQDTPIAVSIPLFRSGSNFNETRFREVHIKGAVWAAIGILHNTDLGEHGVPVYFHVEQSVVEIAVDEMRKYGVPVDEMIRSVSIPEPPDKGIQHPHYGKKLMGLADTEKARDVWLIVDSDAFACTTENKMQWYATLSELTQPAPLIATYHNPHDTEAKYRNWVHGVALGTGNVFDPNNTDYHAQEQAFIESVNFPKSISDDVITGVSTLPSLDDNPVSRPYVSTHILAIPTFHHITPFLQDFYPNCYQDEFLLGLWWMHHNTLIDLKSLLNIQHYKKETPFVNRDKSKDKDGYLAHITPDYGKTEQTQVDTYFGDFYQALAPKTQVISGVGSAEFEKKRNENILKAKPKPKLRIRERLIQLRIHVLGVAYGRSSKDMLSSPFVQRTVKLPEMFSKLGHIVFHYGHECSEVNCYEHITVTNDEVLKRAYPNHDMRTPPKNARPDDIAFRYFHANAERELRKRVQPDDIVLSLFGWGDKPLCDRIRDLPCHIVEASIGYPDSFNDYRVFQSPSKMHFERGRASAVVKMRHKYPDSEPAKNYRTWETLTENVPDIKSTVIPPMYDPRDIEYSPNHKGYMLLIGRVDPCKGLDIAIKLAEYTGDQLIVAGPGDINSANVPIPKNVEYVGVLDLKGRSDAYRDARVVVLPSRFLEPGMNTHIEANGAGKPIIVPDHGITMDYVIQGFNGFKCQPDDFADFVEAYENIEIIKPENCRDYAMNFSLDRISLMYHEYFHKIIRNAYYDKWEVPPKDDRTDLDWRAFPEIPYPAEKVESKIKAIQDAITAETETLKGQKKGVCVQIGIQDSADFAYLADRDWQSKMETEPPLKSVPEAVADGIERWEYYGIDADCVWIAEMLKRDHPPNTHWIQAFIAAADGRVCEFESMMSETRIRPFATVSVTLDTLLQDLEITNVDVLAVDVEGAEFDVFEAYDWSIKPRYITVECHGDRQVTNVANEKLLDQNVGEMIDFLKTKGYDCTHKAYTNRNSTGNCTAEVQFLLADSG